MRPPTPTDRVLALFSPWMEARGFRYVRKGHRYRRPFERGHHEFDLDFDGRGGFVSVTAGFWIYFTDLGAQQARFGMPEWQLGRTLYQVGARRSTADLYLDRYMNMTPRERKGISSETIHPQERIEHGVRFLQDSFLRYAQPAFEAITTERQLADLYLRRLRGQDDAMSPDRGFVLPFALLLAARLGDDPRELLDIAAELSKTDMLVKRRVEAVTSAGVAGVA